MVRRRSTVVLALLCSFSLCAYFFLSTPSQDRINWNRVTQTIRYPEHSKPWSWIDSTRFHTLPDGVSASKNSDLCAGFPTYHLKSIQVTLKTGAAESSDRVKSAISSVAKCLDNLLVVSDADYKIGPFTAVDMLADLPPSHRFNNSDFEEYEAQRLNVALGHSMERTKKGWRLDRYKFLPMVERAYETNPNAKWFVFIEADTYMVWDNLFRLLDNLSPSEIWYIGSPAPGRRPKENAPPIYWFAYGGAGFVLSAAAMEKLLYRTVGTHGDYTQPSLTEQYQQEIKQDCCGDSMLGWALWQKGIVLAGLYPMFNPHNIHSAPYTSKMWCQPIISMHKNPSEDVVGLWEWEQKRNRSRPLLYADLMDYVLPGNFSTRSDWENSVGNEFYAPGVTAHESFENCGEECRNNGECFQYTYHLHKCLFVRAIRLGTKKEPAGEGSLEEKRYMAGWNLDKIMGWKRAVPCHEPEWVKPSIERIF